MTTTQTDRLASVSSLGIKAPCRVSSDVNLTLSGTQTVDGVSLSVGDRVLVNGQTDPVENGIYLVGDGAWQRARDFDGAWDSAKGAMVRVNEGTGAGLYTQATDAIIGTDNISFINSDDFFTFESFGATGNGTTDDSAALQSLIDWETVGTFSWFAVKGGGYPFMSFIIFKVKGRGDGSNNAVSSFS